MINFFQKKLLLLLLVTTNVAVPMEDQFLHNISQQNFCPISTNATLSMAQPVLSDGWRQQALIGINILATITLGFQILYFVTLRAQNCLFGTERIPDKGVVRIRNTLIAMDVKQTAYANVIIQLMSSVYNVPLPSDHRYFNFITGLLTTCSMIHVSNFVYDDALAFLRRVLITREVDITTLPDARCPMCWDDEPDKKYFAREDHVFCSSTCMVQCLSLRRTKNSFIRRESFFCIACVKEVPFRDINKKVTLKLCREQMGIHHVITYLLGIYTIGALLYPYLI